MKSFYRTMRSQGLRRGPKRLLGGVLGGLARATKIDVAWLRIGFLLFCLLPGPAFLLYLSAWAIVPDQDDKIVLEKLSSRKRT